SKPHPQMLLDIIDWYGVDANETIMVGDTEYDLLMANNADANSIGVTYGVHEEQRLLNCKPLICVDNMNDLHHWLIN
ncbi:MAG: HAD hydrolase-like protein, partial [Gammaproteobacteria bacterium]|nr:HAD hydrolase-like protein [Gammaproteobacteria bacterium]